MEGGCDECSVEPEGLPRPASGRLSGGGSGGGSNSPRRCDDTGVTLAVGSDRDTAVDVLRRCLLMAGWEVKTMAKVIWKRGGWTSGLFPTAGATTRTGRQYMGHTLGVINMAHTGSTHETPKCGTCIHTGITLLIPLTSVPGTGNGGEWPISMSCCMRHVYLYVDNCVPLFFGRCNNHLSQHRSKRRRWSVPSSPSGPQ